MDVILFKLEQKLNDDVIDGLTSFFKEQINKFWNQIKSVSQMKISRHISANGPMYIGFYNAIKIVAIHPPPTSHQQIDSRKL